MRLFVLILIVFNQLSIFGCSSSESIDDRQIGTRPLFIQSSIQSGAQDVSFGAQTITLVFDQNIVLANNDAITLNGDKLSNVVAAFKDLKITVPLLKSTSYTLKIANNAIKGPTGLFADAITVSFQTKEGTDQSVKSKLVVSSASPQAEKLYGFLRENFGKKTLTGAMANVSWNTNEAEWIFKHTGKYPALNGFDILHLYASPASWINYSDTKVLENWWNANGVVTLMWHWNVPATNGSSDYKFYTKETSFDISKAVEEGTYENGIIKADLDKAADVLVLLKNKNIPILWRPLHEAAGKWFWWGAKDAVSYRKLWVLMFDYFQSKGLNNLIWVWTSETNDKEWYPGDAYVDIVSCDLYNRVDNNTILTVYNYLRSNYSDKIITLSEFGSISDFTSQWNSGIYWSWLMPWYDYNRTLETNSANFDEPNHQHANINYWKKIMASDNVLTRDQLPNLK
ncbi:glycosyl hydrolase [Sphingobacterium bovistauri]|uniref:Beta-mannosidase n=1 Tax=Sphingobacterium bovistauri TaxID=2781959 RepID=A0ABS7Z6H6_9SPHI|nr:glycosyl hydrolase [Sphingobacterium bovistauri]MCA5005157.1 beta-mannosidase [Sphingobacterium bovistauri]